MLASIRPVYCMEYIFSDVKPLLTNMELSHWRQGAIETLQCILQCSIIQLTDNTNNSQQNM